LSSSFTPALMSAISSLRLMAATCSDAELKLELGSLVLMLPLLDCPSGVDLSLHRSMYQTRWTLSIRRNTIELTCCNIGGSHILFYLRIKYICCQYLSLRYACIAAVIPRLHLASLVSLSKVRSIKPLAINCRTVTDMYSIAGAFLLLGRQYITVTTSAYTDIF